MPISEHVRRTTDCSPELSNGEQTNIQGGSVPARNLHSSDDCAAKDEARGKPAQDFMGSEQISSSQTEESQNAGKPPENLLGASTTPSGTSASDKPIILVPTHLNGSAREAHGEDDPTKGPEGDTIPISEGGAIIAADGVSGWSHQALAPHKTEVEDHKPEDEWQDMPAFAPYDIYNDDGKLVAREERDSDGEGNAYEGLGGAGKGYTRVQVDEDALSATSMDDNTSYLFKDSRTNEAFQDEEQRDALAQLQATKDLLTEGQRIAYVGVTRLALVLMVKELDDMESTKGTKKEYKMAVDSMKMWSQQMMLRLYAHMEIDTSGPFDCSNTSDFFNNSQSS